MDENDKKVVESFDLISQLENSAWNHNNHYYKRVIKMIKTPQASVLDIGCGDGDFLSLCLDHGYRCVGVDFSSGMIEKAKKNVNAANCDFICGDIYDELPKFPKESFDAVVSFAAMHHLNYEKILPLIERVMKKNGIYCVVDIFDCSTPLDYLFSICAIIPNIIRKKTTRYNEQQSAEAQRIWKEHGKLDKYMKYSDIQAVIHRAGYKYKLRRLLYFRYMLLIRF